MIVLIEAWSIEIEKRLHRERFPMLRVSIPYVLPLSPTANRIFAIRRLACGKICLGFECHCRDLSKRALKGLAMVLEVPECGQGTVSYRTKLMGATISRRILRRIARVK